MFDEFAEEYQKEQKQPETLDSIFEDFERTLNLIHDMEKENHKKQMLAFACGVMVTILIARLMPKR